VTDANKKAKTVLMGVIFRKTPSRKRNRKTSTARKMNETKIPIALISSEEIPFLENNHVIAVPDRMNIKLKINICFINFSWMD
jgi:uncharacterized protein YhbP (UPF0306 family)